MDGHLSHLTAPVRSRSSQSPSPSHSASASATSSSASYRLRTTRLPSRRRYLTRAKSEVVVDDGEEEYDNSSMRNFTASRLGNSNAARNTRRVQLRHSFNFIDNWF